MHLLAFLRIGILIWGWFCGHCRPGCEYSTWDPKRVYQVGDRVEFGNRCVIDGDGYYLSIRSDNRGNDPRASAGLYWHHSCGVCGIDSVTVLIDEYETLKKRRN